jgi:hypothetical protein
MDCAFDEFAFFAITASLWLLMSVLCFTKASLPRGSAPSGAARWCLLSTAASSLCLSADAVAYLLTGPHGGKPPRFVNQVFMAVGTFFLGFGMRWFAWLWCTISDALDSQSSINSDGHLLGARLVRIVWWCYNLSAFVNVPFALVIAVSGTPVVPSYTGGVKVWYSWVLLSTCLVLTIAAVLMWICVTKCLPKAPNVGSLITVTKINLVEQLIYIVALAAAGALCMSPAYNEYGMVQAAVFTLMFIPAWIMHIQMLIFFGITQSDDAFYSQKRLQCLLLLAAPELRDVVDAVAAVADSDATVAAPKPAKIGSPMPESAQQQATLGVCALPAESRDLEQV